ncbi:rhamnogalacturonan acetylesterase [soil metagenome]
MSVRIVLAGDSTVTTDNGWGPGFAAALGAGFEVINFAKGGRSSKSFRYEGLWQKCLDAKGEWLLIQFGHNDCPGKGPERETNPHTTYRENLSRFIDEARAAGSKPVLITSLARRKWTATGRNDVDVLSLYALGVWTVAGEKNVPLIDLYRRSIDVYESQGEAAWKALSPSDTDTTHLNAAGGEIIGRIVADEFRRHL